MKSIAWYFDFISPFAYLQSECMDYLPGELTLRYKPVLFAGLLNHWGQRGPAEIATKRRFTYRHVLWQAERMGIRMTFPPAHPFNPLKALRLAIAGGNTPTVVHAIFRFIWGEGRDPNDPGEFSQLAAELGIADAETRIGQSTVKDALKSNTQEAIEAGVFGVPTFVADGELFWGFDATDMVVDFLAHPEHFASGAYQRVNGLPIAAARK